MLSERIKELRIDRGLSQVQLGAVLGVSKQSVSNWENDNILPSIEMLVKLADYFNVSADYLLGRSQTRTLDVSKLSGRQTALLSMLAEEFIK